ncbi:hypothetical protein [Paremcibacter congregatus]|uniref:Uncharacterized protein n=1 Tax=Paremcibacter congregatus TaxID=2043170 RepID=A0A2G4YMC9_9PROT|nr:hypothetical protein [Paremcibacter congregatus]PHZ83472.1 hypothetical protein CRD36_18120 [Paremcibacter congregatus]QDE28061.1 hypothetical protein FIV45_12685 [Paremcibacter congregatus]
MNRIKKNITTYFYSIDAHEDFFTTFISNFKANKEASLSTKIFNLKSKKHLIKIFNEQVFTNTTAYAVTVVRERNTWQTKATNDGKITGVSLNQGIIGDPYFFFVVPDRKMLLGFTSGPSGSIKAVGKILLEQFSSDRTDRIKLNLIPKEQENYVLAEYHNLQFSFLSSYFSNISDDAPQIIQGLKKTAPYIGINTQLAVTLECNDFVVGGISKDSIIEIINYLSEHEGCAVLKVKGVDGEGKRTYLDFVNAFLNYKIEIATRNKFIDENTAIEVLNKALIDYLEKK